MSKIEPQSEIRGSIFYELRVQTMLKFLSDEPLYEMTNVRGRKVRTDKVDFSFIFSSKRNVQHGIRVKIVWDRDKMGGLDDFNSGTMHLHGDYEYEGVEVSFKKLNSARDFFKKYKVLFSAVWEYALNPDSLDDYLKGYERFDELLRELRFSPFMVDVIVDEVHAAQRSSVYANWPEAERNLKILEDIVRSRNLFSMND